MFIEKRWEVLKERAFGCVKKEGVCDQKEKSGWVCLQIEVGCCQKKGRRMCSQEAISGKKGWVRAHEKKGGSCPKKTVGCV